MYKIEVYKINKKNDKSIYLRTEYFGLTKEKLNKVWEITRESKFKHKIYDVEYYHENDLQCMRVTSKDDGTIYDYKTIKY